ncbi:MAG: AAA family ATPase [Acidimicrobiia bacterium]
MRDGTWTIVFTDLVGSTEQRTRLGDDVADELRRAHDAIIARAVARHDGEVVKGTGDGCMAAFTGAAEALACSVAIQQDIDRRNRRAVEAEPLAVRIGISLGDARADDGDLFGTPVVEAARLCDLAGTHGIFCTDVVRIVAGSRAVQEFESMGPLELKGIPDPVPTSRVGWEPLPDVAEEARPLPPGLDPGTRFAFVGRDEHLGTLVDQWKAAAVDGERGVVLVAGEPGIGKTRLATEIALRANAQGATVLFGRCDDELGVPYQPFVEALTWDVDHAPAEELTDRLGRYGGELTRLVPNLPTRARGLPEPLQSDPETEQYRLFEAVAGWLAAVSRDTPVLLVLDDLHWAAKPTLLMLRHIVSSPEVIRLLIVGTYRDTDLDRTHPLGEALAELRRRENVARVSLVGLDEAGVVDFLESSAGHGLDAAGVALAHAIHAETEGNPLFVGEVLRHLAETGRIYEKEGRWTSDDPSNVGIPEGVREVIGRRLSRLSDAANETLTLAAVIGRGFELRVLVGISELEEDALLELVDEAVEARLVREVGVGRYQFSHALVRSALYDEVRPTRLARLHHKIGEAIEGVHANRIDRHLGELAHHYSRAASTDPTKALEYCRRAAEHALDQRAPDEAVTYYEQARELLDDVEIDDPTLQCEILSGLGVAQRRAGVSGYREVLLEAGRVAERAGEVDLLVRATLDNHRGFFSTVGDVDTERVEMVRTALEALGDEDSPERAQLLANLSGEVVFGEDLAGRRAINDDALTIARRLGDPATLAHVLISRSVALWEPSTLDERLVLTTEAMGIADELGDPYLQFFAYWYRYATCVEHADAAELATIGPRLEQLASEVGQATPLWMDVFTRSGRAASAGEHELAEELMNAQLEVGQRAGHPDAVFFYGVLLFAVRRNQGRLDEIVDLARVAVEDSAVAGIEVMLGVTLIETGQLDAAREVFDRIATDLLTLPQNQIWTSILWGAAVISHGLDLTELAARIRERLEPHADQLVYNGLVSFGAIASVLGLLSLTLVERDAAIAYFERGAEMEERVGDRANLARTRLWWAQVLLERGGTGDAERASELLTATKTVAEELGMSAVLEQAKAASK